MNRRRFLAHASSAALLSAIRLPDALRHAPVLAASSRAATWPPTSSSGTKIIAAEWRYLAGRIISSTQDYGFIISIGMTRSTQSPFSQTYQLLVERVGFVGAGGFVHTLYDGERAYDPTTATYTFTGSDPQISATLQLDLASSAAQYRVNLTTPELTFADLLLLPQTDLVDEGGSGTIDVGEARGYVIGSDYHADWLLIKQGEATIGTARLDMQSLYPNLQQPAQPTSDYDHHWFAIAGEVDDTPLFISAWRIESARGPRWNVTIARPGWAAQSFTHDLAAAQPLLVQPLGYQPLAGYGVDVPAGEQIGTSWRIQAGVSRAGDLIDIVVEVPPGQVISSSRLSALGGAGLIEEAIGIRASGSVQGKPLITAYLVVAESTMEVFPRFAYLPLVSDI